MYENTGALQRPVTYGVKRPGMPKKYGILLTFWRTSTEIHAIQQQAVRLFENYLRLRIANRFPSFWSFVFIAIVFETSSLQKTPPICSTAQRCVIKIQKNRTCVKTVTDFEPVAREQIA